MQNDNKLKVVDIFCGAGGFSEGFRQMGFYIIHGVDRYQPAIDTFNFNFNLSCIPQNVLEFESSVKKIEALPDSEVIIGSPPCVSFSNSNKSGKADKSLGNRLVLSFLRIVAIKKHQPKSILKAWVMENVPKALPFLQDQYTFKELNLTKWAERNSLDPTAIAIDLTLKKVVLNSADYGSPQNRKRLIAGEITGNNDFPVPSSTHKKDGFEGDLLPYRTLGDIKNRLPKPTCKPSYRRIPDPNYPLSLPLNSLTDHFYDTGLYEVQWRNSRYYKVNHPYMGRMSFPENEKKPSRTLTATNIGTSRESIIYKSEHPRKGDGEFRGPTVREGACIMGFPITYQFLGKESAKWRMVGNAVCPTLSAVIAQSILSTLGYNVPKAKILCSKVDLSKVGNLNTFSPKKFDNPPKKKTGSKFRRHPVKKDNVAVTLSNYPLHHSDRHVNGKWYTTIFYGIGEGYKIQQVKDGRFLELEGIISEFPKGNQFLEVVKNGFSEMIGSSKELQSMYEEQSSTPGLLEPTMLIDKVQEVIEGLNLPDQYMNGSTPIFSKDKIHVKHIFAFYAVNLITTITNE